MSQANQTVERIKTLMTRHNLTADKTAKYLGVPVYTLRKWLNGERKPNSSAERLIEVLGMIEVLAPTIHDNLLKGEEEIDG